MLKGNLAFVQGLKTVITNCEIFIDDEGRMR